jgi:hypothetical protein
MRQAPSGIGSISFKELEMANIEVKKVEEQLNHGLLFTMRVNADEGHMEFPIGIQDQGSPAANEAVVLASTLAFAEELEAAARRRLGATVATHR